MLKENDLADTSAAIGTCLISLYRNQIGSWPEFAQSCAALKEARYRSLMLDGNRISIQFNPRRLGNITAEKSKSGCFLCAHNLSSQQLRCDLLGGFIALCNLKPIFPYHITIAHAEHIPQTLLPHLPVFLELAREAGPFFF